MWEWGRSGELLPFGSVRRVMGALALFSATLISAGCTDESPADQVRGSAASANHRPVIREASIVPTPLVLTAPLFVQIHAEDLDRDTLTFHHQWIVNGRALPGQTASTFPATLLKQGDRVSVEIVPDDGKERGDVYRTAAVPVINSPPVISALVIRPSQTDPSNKLEALVEVADPDHDEIELSYRWWKNNALAKEGEDPVLEVDGFSPEDVVRVEATARDRASLGQRVMSSPLRVGNRPPMIVSSPPQLAHGDRYEYDLKAMDPEGDALRFRLEVAPPGMVIETETGHLVWQEVKSFKGTHKVRIVAEDSHGGTAFQEFEISLAPPILSSPEGA